MIDFNDEKITEEQKQDTLLQQIDPVYKEKRIQYGVQPFKASWIISYRMLEVLNNNAHTNEGIFDFYKKDIAKYCLLYTSPSPRDLSTSRMPSSA